VARLAVALRGVVEEREAAQLLLGQAHVAAQELVVLAREAAKPGVFALVGLQRERQTVERIIGAAEDVGAEDLLELICVGGTRQLVDDIGLARIRHLVGGKQRVAGLVLQRACPAIPEEAAGRRAVRGEVERRVERQVVDRRGAALALLVEQGPAELHRQIVLGRVAVDFDVAARARLAPRGRQGDVGKDALAELGLCRHRLLVRQIGRGSGIAAPAAACTQHAERCGARRSAQPTPQPIPDRHSISPVRHTATGRMPLDC
jgi:hypothetical protein